MHGRANRIEPRAVLALGRNARIVDEGVEGRTVRLQTAADFGNGVSHILLVGQIDADVILRAGRPGAVLGKFLPGTGDHPPSFAGEALDRRMADAARGTGEDERLAAVSGGFRHGELSVGVWQRRPETAIAAAGSIRSHPPARS